MIIGNNLPLRRSISEKLNCAGIPSADFEAAQLVTAFGQDENALSCAIERRLCGEPLQYILGEWEFYGITLKVDNRALIPRADTETLVEAALGFLKNKTNPKIIDLCSGTGCIALAVAQHSGFSVTAVEKYRPAYELLCENISLCKIPVTALCDDILTMQADNDFDLILSNPPYINSADIQTLQREVQHEPKTALDGGADGLDFYRALAQKWAPRLNKNGMLAVEIGINQQDAVAQLFTKAGLQNITFYKDLSGIIRVVSGEK